MSGAEDAIGLSAGDRKAKNIRRAAKRSSGPVALAHLKFLIEHKQALETESGRSREAVSARFEERAATVITSLRDAHARCSEGLARVSKALGDLLRGLQVEIPLSEWQQRADARRTVAPASKPAFGANALEGGLSSILRAVAKISAGGGERNDAPRRTAKARRKVRRAQRRRSAGERSRRKSAASETILQMFPFLTLPQAKAALRQCGGDVAAAIDWLLEKDGSSVDWAKDAKAGDSAGTPDSAEEPDREPAVVVQVTDAGVGWVRCEGVFDDEREPYGKGSEPFGFLPIDVVLSSGAIRRAAQ